jgi:choline dehydrogenase-like flavoprotein
VAEYVIVGAGSAGCVVAGRLAEAPDVSVAVLEAGPPDADPEIQIPLAFGQLLMSRIDWNFVSEPEPGLDSRRIYLPRGRVLGGSSSLNAMVYMRGNREDYDEWEALGAAGWSFDDVLPYFKRAEDNERGESYYHGTGGPLGVSDSRSMHPLVDSMIDAAREYGVEPNDDPNGATQDGTGRWQATIRSGRRCSAAAGYLHPAVARGNVEVITDAFATRLLFEGSRAIGVEYLKDNQLHQIRAEQEVIVSAGAYQSPQLLMLSGIGPARELGIFGIDVREDLPVGEHLQDHAVISMLWLTDEDSLLAGMTPANLDLFEREGRGPFASNVGEGGAFLRTRDGLVAPDVQYHFCPIMLHEELLGPLLDEAYSLSPTLLKPTSRGFVKLRSPLPHAKPRIQHNYFQTDEDRQSMIEGVRIALEFNRQPALQKVTREGFLVPASTSERDVMRFIERRAHTIYHPTGTCSIGCVVDPELRVYGFEGLRVIDASVMPTLPRGNTNAPTIMVGEKGADLLRGLPPLPPQRIPAEAGT